MAHINQLHGCHKALMGYISTMTQEDFLEEVVPGIAKKRQKQ